MLIELLMFNKMIFLIRFSSNVFKLIIISYNNYLGCLDIRFKFCQRYRFSVGPVKACFHKDFTGKMFALAKST